MALLTAASPGTAQDNQRAAPAKLPARIEIATTESDQNGTIIVTGIRERAQSLGALGDRPVLDTPFSIGGYDAALLKDTQATNFTDVLKLEPSATVQATSFNEGTEFQLRGFAAGDDFYTDGIPGLGGYRTDAPIELYDGVQILKGAAGFLYGFTAPGGIVNFITKRPRAEPFASVTAGYQQDSLWRGALDTGIASADGRFGTRLNVAGERGRSIALDTGLRRFAAGLNSDVEVTPTTKLQLDLLHSRRRMIGNIYGIGVAEDIAVPRPISGRTDLSSDAAGFRADVESAAGALIQQLGASWTARVDGSIARRRFNYYDGFVSILNPAGDITYSRSGFNQRTVTTSGQLLLSGKATTGPIDHALAFGAFLRDDRGDYGRNAAGDFFIAADGVAAGNIYTGVALPDLAIDVPSLSRAYRASHIIEKAVFASDTLSLGTHWQLLLGGRYVWRKDVETDPDGSRNFYENASKFTPTAALLWKPVPNVTTYLSYAQSLQPGGAAGPDTQNAGQHFPVIASKQYEAGVKAELGGLLATAAIFRIEQGFEYDRPVSGQLPIHVQDGIERHDGFELALSGKLGEAIRLVGGVQVLDATVRDSAPELLGKAPPDVPKVQAKLFAEYAPPALRAAAINAGLSYTGGSYYDALNTQQLDGYFLAGLGARYGASVSGTPVTLRASVDNLFDKKYWLPRGSLIPGTPRTINVSASIDF